MKITWTSLALERVYEIAKYIAEDSLESSNKWVDQIFNKVKRLEKFPESGRKIKESNRKEVREIIFGNYRVIYRIGRNQIYILTVRHLRQILPEVKIK